MALSLPSTYNLTTYQSLSLPSAYNLTTYQSLPPAYNLTTYQSLPSAYNLTTYQSMPARRGHEEGDDSQLPTPSLNPASVELLNWVKRSRCAPPNATLPEGMRLPVLNLRVR
ncbi:hypothetical protein DV735_g5440, partial [Chaetothyriales sp. CBS 134920]